MGSSNHRKRCRRINAPGHAHALTFSCFRRQPFLSKDRTRRWFIEALDQARQQHHFALWAYVVMPEHAHLLICPSAPTYSISDILSTIKQSVSKRALHYLRQQAPRFLQCMEDRQPSGATSHRFWQRGGGYDRNIVESKTLWSHIEYIHANPVRRKLCLQPIDWQWSSAVEFHSPGSGVLPIDFKSLPEATGRE